MSRSSVDALALSQALQRDLKAALSCDSVALCVPFGDLTISRVHRRAAIEMMQDKFLSKFVPDRDVALDRAACVSFLSGNERCKAWTVEELTSNDSDMQLFGEFMKIVEDFFTVDLGQDVSLSWGNVALNAKCGPGKASGSNGNSSYEKLFAGPIGYSSLAVLDLYRGDCYLWPELGCADNIRQLEFGEPTLVTGSRTSFVPKTSKTSRMIAVEPTLNVYYQLGLGEIISKRLSRFFGIHLDSQPDENRYLAYLGSQIDTAWGDGFATIDLSSASDCISLKMCSHIIPSDWLSAMLALRSSSTTVLLGKERFTVNLAMMSTMGNGFTFPLQTALFACAAAACVAMDDNIRRTPTSWSSGKPGGLFSVFGDDIIIHSRAAPRLLRFLKQLGFIPNPEKCFDSGMFRESCGRDYYNGHNVRPVFLKKLSTEQDFSVLFNLLTDWSARNCVRLPEALGWLLKTASRRFGGLYPVPLSENMDAGIKLPHTMISGLALKRDPSVRSISYLCWEARSSRSSFSETGFIPNRSKSAKKRDKRLLFNPPGLYWSFLRGEVRNHSIGIDHPDAVAYRTKARIIPYWDYRVPSPLDARTGVSCGPVAYARHLHYMLMGIVKRSHLSLRRKRLA